MQHFYMTYGFILVISPGNEVPTPAEDSVILRAP